MDGDRARLLSGETFENETFDKLDLAGADLGGKELTRCTFRGSKLGETRWAKSRLEDCVFDGCDLTSFRPKQMAARGVEFVHCKLMGVEWALLGTYPVLAFSDCSMRYQSFASIALRKTRFSRCSLLESTFVEVDLAKSTFSDCELTLTQFDRCDLGGVDFSSSRGVYFDTTKNRCKGARIPVETAALMATALGLVVSGYGDDREE